jgi:hypothetical protein
VFPFQVFLDTLGCECLVTKRYQIGGILMNNQ